MKTNNFQKAIIIIVSYLLISVTSCRSTKKVIPITSHTVQEKKELQSQINSYSSSFVYDENSVYEIDISPNKILDISLESGEIPSEKIAVMNSNYVMVETIKTNQNNQDTYHVMIRALQDEGKTIMLLPTSKRMYHFNLNIKEDIEEIKINFVYKDEKNTQYSKSIKRDISKFSFSYSVKGKTDVSPEIVFSDTKSTYFKFKDDFINSNVCPALFLDDGNSLSIINYSISGCYYITNFILSGKESFVFILDNKKARVIRNKI